MDIWLALSFLPPEDMVPLSRLAEECGYTGVVLPDHLVWPQNIESSYPHAEGGKATWSSDASWVDTWVTASAIMQATTTLRFATNVYIPLLRSSLVVAKAVSTAAILSGYRVSLGVGTGWLKEEFDVAGVEFAARGKALDDHLDQLRQLWSGEVVQHPTDPGPGGGIRMLPAPSQSIPILVGGMAEPALRRAARHDGWIGVLHKDVTQTADAARRMLAYRREAPRAGEPFLTAVTGFTEDPAVIDQLEQAGVESLFLTMGLARQPAESRPDSIRAYAERIIATRR
jgi:alkanesulfonate monooxygenase SsuD/methylene tetrahydromethanopterin reductase-like flavin-dependent oxidoreductase (luciferase family)